MTVTFEANTSIGPGGLLTLTSLPYPEGSPVHVKVEPTVSPKGHRSGFMFGLHAGMVEVPVDFNDPLPDSFWLGTDEPSGV